MERLKAEQCVYEKTIQKQEKVLEQDTTVILRDLKLKQDTGVVESGKTKRHI